VARPYRVLFVCTHNSARSQIAEALVRRLGGDAFEAESAGSEPSGRVHPLALRVIGELGGDPARHRSKGLADALRREWDLVVTVCDDARDACPVLPPGTRVVHWGMTDPSRVDGSEEERVAAFGETARALGDRIRRFIASHEQAE